MIRFPTTIEEAIDSLAATPGARVRAGGTEESVLRAAGQVSAPLVDLRDLDRLRTVELGRGGLRIGARATLAEVAGHAVVAERYPALAQAASTMATPQIRAQATVGGNLLQEVRCWYLRHPAFPCLKQGGASCFARAGDHSEHSLFDLSTCVATHPSTLAMVAWLFDARIELDGDRDALRTVPEMLGSGADPRRTHALPPGSIITAIILPQPSPGERSAYARTTSRARSEWPLVEAAVRIRASDERVIRHAQLAVGAVAVRPLRLPEVAAGLVGLTPEDGAVGGVLATAGGPSPGLPQTAYKAQLLPPTLLAAILAAVGDPPAPPEPPAAAEPAAAEPSSGKAEVEAPETEDAETEEP